MRILLTPNRSIYMSHQNVDPYRSWLESAVGTKLKDFLTSDFCLISLSDDSFWTFSSSVPFKLACLATRSSSTLASVSLAVTMDTRNAFSSSWMEPGVKWNDYNSIPVRSHSEIIPVTWLCSFNSFTATWSESSFGLLTFSICVMGQLQTWIRVISKIRKDITMVTCTYARLANVTYPWQPF